MSRFQKKVKHKQKAVSDCYSDVLYYSAVLISPNTIFLIQFSSLLASLPHFIICRLKLSYLKILLVITLNEETNTILSF